MRTKAFLNCWCLILLSFGVNVALANKGEKKKDDKKETKETNHTTNKKTKAQTAIKKEVGKPYKVAVRLFYSPRLLTNTTYSTPFFMAPAVNAKDKSASSLWDNTSTASSSDVSFGGEVEIAPARLSIGTAYHVFMEQTLDSNYDNTKRNPFVGTSTKGSSISVYADSLFLKISYFKMGLGLETEFSTVSLTSAQKSDEDASLAKVIYTAASKGTVLSVRIPMHVDIPFGSMGVTLGTTPAIPVFAKIAPATITTDDEQNAKKLAIDPSEDLAASLKHTKSRFGLEFLLGFYYGF